MIGLEMVCVLALAGSPCEPADETPNVVLILADDMGLDSVSAFNSTMGMKTPAIDVLAARGMSFLDAHSTSGVCSPTRYALMTGRYSWRSRLKRGIVAKWERPLIAPDRLTIGEMFQDAGYDTACIGKWHLGFNWPTSDGGFTQTLNEIDFTRPTAGGPVDRGFDSYFGDDVPNWPPFAWRKDSMLLAQPTDTIPEGVFEGVRVGPGVPGWDFTAVLPEYVKRCGKYIRGRAEESTPFFLYFSMPSPHTPIAPAERFKGVTGVSDYADFLHETDWAIGQLLKALEESGQAKNTVIIFTCDNGTSPKADFPELERGGVRINDHWRGYKSDIWEGGHRVPFVVVWPGHIDAGSVSTETIALTDVMATCAQIIGSEIPPDMAEDSVSLLPVLLGMDVDAPLHDIVIHHSGSGHFAVRKGGWKLLLSRSSGGWSPPSEQAAAKKEWPIVQLYNLGNDPMETTNLESSHPEKVSELVADLVIAFKRGRTTSGPDQLNEGWPGRFGPQYLQRFPELTDPTKASP